MKLVQNFMLFLPVALASSLGEEGVHSGAGTITATLPRDMPVRAQGPVRELPRIRRPA